jgi:hypothetical protein
MEALRVAVFVDMENVPALGDDEELADAERRLAKA